MTTYKDSGVNIKAGDDLSKYIYEQIKSTWKGGKFGIFTPLDDFSGFRCVDVTGLLGAMIGLNFDGVGTKIEIAELLGNFSTIGYDLMAMVCDDAVIRGAEPIIVGSILDFNHIPVKHSSQLKNLIDGYVSAAKEAGVQIINGEVAELGDRIGGYGDLNLNWGAGVVWIARKDRFISGKDIEVGDKIVVFQEDGFRSNGISLVRKIFRNNMGMMKSKRRFILKQILTPSKIYTSAIVDMTGGFTRERKVDIKGMAHITGGGLPGKVGRMLKPCGYGARFDSLFYPPLIMRAFQNWGDVKSREAYRIWNMGNGFVVVTKDLERVITIAKSHGIEAKVGGEIIEEPVIKIRNCGVSGKSGLLRFNLKKNEEVK